MCLKLLGGGDKRKTEDMVLSQLRKTSISTRNYSEDGDDSDDNDDDDDERTSHLLIAHQVASTVQVLHTHAFF